MRHFEDTEFEKKKKRNENLLRLWFRCLSILFDKLIEILLEK